MASYLLLDADDITINCIELKNVHDWPVPVGMHLVPYNGPFFLDVKFIGTDLIDPNPIALQADTATTATTAIPETNTAVMVL